MYKVKALEIFMTIILWQCGNCKLSYQAFLLQFLNIVVPNYFLQILHNVPVLDHMFANFANYCVQVLFTNLTNFCSNLPILQTLKRQRLTVGTGSLFCQFCSNLCQERVTSVWPPAYGIPLQGSCQRPRIVQEL